MNEPHPITVPQDWSDQVANYDKYFEDLSFCKFLLLLISGRLQRRNPDPWVQLDKEVKEKLLRRSFTIESAWRNYPQYLETVRKLQQLLNECLWRFDPVFIPEDSYYLLGQMLTGDLCEVDMIMSIEYEFDIDIDDSFFDNDLTMLELVEHIKSKMS